MDISQQHSFLAVEKALGVDESVRKFYSEGATIGNVGPAIFYIHEFLILSLNILASPTKEGEESFPISSFNSFQDTAQLQT